MKVKVKEPNEFKLNLNGAIYILAFFFKKKILKKKFYMIEVELL